MELSYCGCSVTNKFRRILYKAQKKDPKIKFLHAAQFSPNQNGSFSLEYGHPDGPLVDLSTFEQLEKYVEDMPERNPILYRKF